MSSKHRMLCTWLVIRTTVANVEDLTGQVLMQILELRSMDTLLTVPSQWRSTLSMTLCWKLSKPPLTQVNSVASPITAGTQWLDCAVPKLLVQPAQATFHEVITWLCSLLGLKCNGQHTHGSVVCTSGYRSLSECLHMLCRDPRVRCRCKTG